MKCPTCGQDVSGLLKPALDHILPWLYIESHWWTAVGLLGGFLFGSRFILQWLTSEAKGRVVVPALFWHLSLWGSTLNLIYFLHLDKLPLLLANFFLPVLYARNLWLYYNPKNKAQEAAG